MKTIAKLLMICVLLAGIWGCGETGSDKDSASETTPAFSYSGADDLQTPFYCSGGTVTFEITHSGTCFYSFDLINKDSRNVRNIATGSGDGDFRSDVSLVQGDYFLAANTACSWIIDVYGPVAQYASYVLCNNYPDTMSPTTCKDHGGTAGVLGCDRVSGYFICSDGTTSDTVCSCP